MADTDFGNPVCRWHVNLAPLKVSPGVLGDQERVTEGFRVGLATPGRVIVGSQRIR